MKKFAVLYIYCLALVACQKDQDIFIPDDSFVMCSIGGLITDSNGQLISNASVNLETKDGIIQTETDENGIFYIGNVELDNERAHLYIHAEAYFPGSRTFVPQNGSIEFVNIRLSQRNQIASFDATSGGSFDIPGGVNMTFPANGIEEADGSSYTGNVNVAVAFLDVVDPFTGVTMPGDLTALSATGERQALATFGMMGVALTSDVGALLQLKEGNLVTLRIPVVQDLRTTAPSTIPLWYFDNENGYWIEEGNASLVGDYYEGKITHFDFWNLAIPQPLVNINTQVYLSDTEMPFANAAAKIKVVDSGVCFYGFTNDKGNLDGTVPTNQVLLLQIFSQCGTVIYETEIGPFSSDTSIWEIVVEPSNKSVRLNGQLIDCDGNGLKEGYARITIGLTEYVFFVSENGKFRGNFDACVADQFTLIGFDMIDFKQSIPVLWETIEIAEVGTLYTCE